MNARIQKVGRTHFVMFGAETSTMFTQTLSPKFVVWKRAAISSLVVTLAAVGVLLGVKSLKAHGMLIGSTVAAASNTNESAIESLSKKIAAENEEHQTLQQKRNGLADTAQQMPAYVLTPAERTRRELISQLVRLLALEKQSSEGSPEIADTRAQIDKLQLQIAEMPASDGHSHAAPSSERAAIDAQLADTDHRITLNDAQTKADVLQLGRLVRAGESVTYRAPASEEGMAASTITIISISLGLMAALLIILLARLYSIRDEASLRLLLPSTVEVIGAIPHMRVRI